MHSAAKSVIGTKEYAFYKSLLFLYPESHRKKFGQEILVLFEDIYQDALVRREKIGFSFWFSLCFDTIKSAGEQHLQLVKKYGMKKYLNKTLSINRYNIIGALLLLPFLSVIIIDLVARIVQGDLMHYNRPVYNLLSHTLFYWTPILLIWVILFPTLAVLLNLIPLLQKITKERKTLFHFSFLQQNAVTLLILAFGLGFLAIVKLHDFAPCFVHGLQRVGIGQLSHIWAVCGNT